MFYQTLMHCNILFICVLLFRRYSAAPVNSSVTYSSFLEEIIEDGCSFPAEVSLPFSSKDTFEYLARPLQICKAPDTTKRTKETILLCSEIFDTLKNITCHPQVTQLPKIEVTFSDDVCNDIKAINFPNTTDNLLKHLKDKIVCDLMCDGDFQPACTVLLWSYKVQKQIEDSKNAPKLEENKEAEKPVIKNLVLSEKQSEEEPKQIKVTLTNGNSMQDDKHIDNAKITAIKDMKNAKQIELVTGPLVSPNVEDAKSPDESLKSQNNINPEVSPKGGDLLIATKEPDQPISNLQQNNQGEITKKIVNIEQSFEGEHEAKSVNNEKVGKNDNKSAIASVQENVSKNKYNNELGQTTNAKIITKTNKSGTSKKKELDMNSAKVEPKKDIVFPNISNHPSIIQTKENKEKEQTKSGFPEGKKTSVNLKDTKNQTDAVTSNQKLNGLSPKIETKVATTPELLSLQSEEPIVQPEPTPPKKAEPSNNAEITETGLGEVTSLTTIADLEKMEEGNEIPESSNKDQDSYNGDDGFFEPPKNKQTDESELAKLPDSISESQSDLSKYPVFPARNSIGQSDDIQVIPQFPEQEDSHFFFYFLSIVVILMAGYLLFHNKQKIIALIVEGRHERRRRSHGVGYKKLDTK